MDVFVIMAFFVMTVSSAFHSTMAHAEMAPNEVIESCHHEGYAAESAPIKAQIPQDDDCCKTQCHCAISHCGAFSHLLLATFVQFADAMRSSNAYAPYDEVAQSYIPDKFKRPPKA